MNDFRLAWKNLWRNKRRTMITASSVFFAVFFALLMRSFQLGAYDRIFKNIIESYSGYLQIQHKDYFDDPVIDNSFEPDSLLIRSVCSDPNVIEVVPRLESFALAAVGSRTQGVIVMGIDPAREGDVTDIRKQLVRYKLSSETNQALKEENIPLRTKKLLDVFENDSYSGEGRLMLDLAIERSDSSKILPIIRKHAFFRNSFLSAEDTSGVLIGNGLSGYLKAGIGDTLVIIGQGYHGTSAAGKFLIKGIVKLPAPDIDNIIVYLPVLSAQELFAAPGMATSAVVKLAVNDNREVLKTRDKLKSILRDPVTIRDWHELNALLINQMEADNRSGMIMIGILYLVIAFGVFGTVLMMMAERRREFGMLVSIGMRKGKLARVVSLEMIFIGLLGLVAGVVASLPIVFYGNSHPLKFTGEIGRMYSDYGFEPVMPTLLPDTYYLWQTMVVLIILMFAIIFSVRKIYRINVISSLRA